MTTFFSKQMECSIEFAGPMDQTADRTYPILETFLVLITKRRFCGVGAPEGLEIAPDILIQHFFRVSDFSLRLGRPSRKKYNFFPQNA